MMNSPNLTTVPLPPAKGRSIDGESRRPGSRTLPRAPDAASKLGKIQSPQMGRIHRPLRDIGGMHDGVHQEALRVDENVPLLALDLLARIVAVRVDARPPFSALFMLWLSMIAAVGEASRSARSRHST